MNSILSCDVCGVHEGLLRCSRCRIVYYCSKEHQHQDWNKHKTFCSRNKPDKNNDTKRLSAAASSVSAVSTKITPASVSSKADNPGLVAVGWNISPITYEGSSESEILNARTEVLSPNLDFRDSSTSPTFLDMPSQEATYAVGPRNTNGIRAYPEISLVGADSKHFPNRNSKEHDILEEISKTVVRHMNSYGLCVVNNFLGPEKGRAVLDEVISMYKMGVFKDGQLVSSKVNSDLKTIRGDQITWIDGKESACRNIGALISKVDSVIIRANKMVNNGKMGEFVINGRTKAMVACYPGNGSHYVKHVDNPNKDGRCITAIYYLNVGWNTKEDGGLLRIFPEGKEDKIADIEPLFDRILFFWSDRRNPHEVQPAFKTRYAITLWYFDAMEREEACRRHQSQRNEQNVAVASQSASH